MDPRILFIDAEPHLPHQLARFLRKYGYETYTAPSGEIGLEILQNNHIDLVLLEQRLPEISGLEVLKQIRKNDQALPVIIVTAFADIASAVSAMKLGAMDYLAKGFDLEELLIAVQRNLEVQKKRSWMVFYCYAREDEVLRNVLEKHLSGLKRSGQIIDWHDRMINAGKEWKKEIDKHLNAAHILLLLISPDFMNSNYCYGSEMKRALERHNLGEARVIPIILRPVHWQDAPFSKLQVLPTDGKPIISVHWNTSDEAFLDVTNGIRKVIEELDNENFPKEKNNV